MIITTIIAPTEIAKEPQLHLRKDLPQIASHGSQPQVVALQLIHYSSPMQRSGVCDRMLADEIK